MSDGIDVLDPRWIRVISHPIRVQTLRYLVEHGQVSPSALARELRISVPVASYHVRYLLRTRYLACTKTTQGRGAPQHHYRLRDLEATRDALGRLGLSFDRSVPGSVAEPTDPWEHLSCVLAELRRRREAQGISRDELARSLRITTSELARIERGESDPRFTILIRMIHELGTSVAEVFAIAQS